jgi:hypothetical protein
MSGLSGAEQRELGVLLRKLGMAAARPVAPDGKTA